MMERSTPFGRRPVDTLDEARRCCDIYAAYKLERDMFKSDTYYFNIAVANAKRDMDHAVAANRRMITKVWG